MRARRNVASRTTFTTVALMALAATVAGSAATASVDAPEPTSTANDTTYVSGPFRPTDTVARDAGSAQRSAFALGQAVEDISQRTATEQVFALPDGTWRAHVYSGTEWVLTGGDGSRESDWSRIHTRLAVDSDALVRPAASGQDIALHPGGGPADFVVRSGIEGTGVVVTVAWDGGVLPAVELDGPRATYVNIAPGVDYVVDVFPSGFEQFYVLHTPEAAAAFDELEIELIVEGGSVADRGDGSVAILDLEGVEVASIPVPTAWDAAEDAKRPMPVLEPWQEVPNLSPGSRPLEGILPGATVDAIEEATEGKDLPVETPLELTATDTGASTLIELSADPAWLAAADTVSPVVIDPTLGTCGDLYVRSNYPTTSYATQSEIVIGTFDSGASRYRSFVNFNTTDLKGKEILSAQLYLWSYHSWTCSARTWNAHMADAAYGSTTWNTQPAAYASFSTTMTATKGYSASCAAGWVTADIKDMVDYWSTSTVTTHAVRLTAGSETDNTYWKRFYSLDWGTSSQRPYLSYTYNMAPNVPTNVKLNGVVPNDPENPHVGIAAGAPVELAATVIDPNGDVVRAAFSIYQDGVLIVSGLPGEPADTNDISTLLVPFPLTPGAVYKVTVTARDATLESEATPPLNWTFGVAGVDPDEIPTICDTEVSAFDVNDPECEAPL